MSKGTFTQTIVEWYERNKRPLPWRLTTDPYKIWLSEIILQQTRVEQGMPYYQHFISRFPDVFALARSPVQQVLRSWQGLGYYSRARNLHSCAKIIVRDYHGKFPTSYSELLQLPGVGSYTAAAIASLAFEEPVPAVDGNVLRVLSRVFGIDEDILSPKGKKMFFQTALQLIPHKRPSVFNQAVMEFGALQCIPRNPTCDACVLSEQCVANSQGWQNVLPVKSKKQKPRKRYVTYIVISSGRTIAMRQRMKKDIWQGLFDFYSIESKRKEHAAKLLQRDALVRKWKNETLRIDEPVHYKHILSHQILIVQFVRLHLKPAPRKKVKLDEAELMFYSPARISSLPKPTLVNRYLHEAGIL
jgi:A/G-specific adenine glycosylase